MTITHPESSPKIKSKNRRNVLLLTQRTFIIHLPDTSRQRNKDAKKSPILSPFPDQKKQHREISINQKYPPEYRPG